MPATPARVVRRRHRDDRARRLANHLLAIIHGYHVPALMDGWLTYDDGDGFEIGFRAHCCSIDFAADVSCELLVFNDGEKQLHVEWDHPEQMTVVGFDPRTWWEDWVLDIQMFEVRMAWEPDVAPMDISCSSGLLAGDRWTAVRAARMRALRDYAAAHAMNESAAYLRTGDQERARAWDDLYEAIRIGGGPERSSGLH
jgi:hypothetical protein